MPMTVVEMMETTARVTRRHFGVLLGLTLIFMTPVVVIGAIVGLALVDAIAPVVPLVPGEPVTLTSAQLQGVLRALAALFAVSLLASLAGAILALAATFVVDADYRASPIAVRASASQALRRTLPVLGAMILNLAGIIGIALVGALLAALVLAGSGGDITNGGPGAFLALIVAVLTLITVVVIAVRWTLVVPVIALEPVGPLRALGRSWWLTGSSIWRAFGCIILVSLVVGVLGAVVNEILGLVAADLPFGAGSTSAILIRTVIGAAVTVVAAPILPVLVTVLYFDLRVRRDGLELGQEQL